MTTSVTGIAMGPFAAVRAVTCTVACSTPASSPAEFTVKVRMAGAEAASSDAVSHPAGCPSV